MTHLVTEACIRCRYTDCVEVCPVDCFYGGPNMLVINPEECIDCGLCVPECPANAILVEDDLSEENRQKYQALNERLARKWPNINRKETAPPDADDWREREDKLKYLEEGEAAGD